MYIFAATADKSKILQVALFDISEINSGKIIFEKLFEFQNNDFKDPLTGEPLKKEFNLREVVHFQSTSMWRKDSLNLGETNHILLSCYNNGIIFFKFSGTNYYTEKSQILNMTFTYPLPNIVNIFTEKAYGTSNSEFTFFTSTPSPPVIYEFRIDNFLNLNLFRIYRSNIDELRYISNDFISSNKNYVAHLLYDHKLMLQVIRIYDRYETNFGIGHITIPVKNLKRSLTAMIFLSFSRHNMIFIKNAKQWEIYDFSDAELVINTSDYAKEYQTWINKTSTVDIIVCS